MAGTEAAKAPPAPPCVMVLFGARGDLAKRLLTPALYTLTREGLLGDGFRVLGVDHNDCSEDAFRSHLREFMQSLAHDKDAEAGGVVFDDALWDQLEKRHFYQTGDFTEDQTYQALGKRLEELKAENVLFYLATSPRFFGEVVERLGKAGLTKEADGAWRRVIIEKPFGEDLQSARELNVRILKVLDERQVFRIDHFLGKETVQNVMAARFANGFFEPIWNREHIDHVQITAAETVTVESRAGFYDKTGALRDMTPNHMFQLLAMVAMEPPNAFSAEAVRTEKARVIDAVRVWSKDEALRNGVRGQYTAGEVAGRKAPAYRDSEGVPHDSRTETFVALKFLIDNWRWSGVPFYVRTGKAMSGRDTEIAIQFKQAPYALFRDTPVEKLTPNFLVLQIQPDEGIQLDFEAKQPGPEMHLKPVNMRFCYKDFFELGAATGYETLLYDAMLGDQTLFQRADQIELGWRAVQPFLDAWAEGGEPEPYAAGEDGPKAAAELLARDGRAWRPVGR